MGDGLEPGRDFLIGLPQELNEVANDVLVTAIEERSAHTNIAGTSRSSNTVNIIINIAGEVIVDDMGDVGDIETTSSNSSGNHDGSLASPESV